MASNEIAVEQLLELLLTLKKTTPAAAKGILNSQPAIAYALITLMVQMNAINVEVFQKTLAEMMPTNPAESSAAGTRPIATGGAPMPPTAPSAIPPHLQAQYRTSTPPSYPPPSALASSSSQQQPPSHTPTPSYGYGGPNGYGQQHQQQGYGGYQQTLPPHQQAPQQSGYHQHYQQQQQQQAPYQQQQQQPYGQYQQQQQHQPTQQQQAYAGYSQYGAPPAPAPAPAPVAPPPALAGALSNIPEGQKALVMRVLAMTPEQINMLPPGDRDMYIKIRTTLGVPT